MMFFAEIHRPKISFSCNKVMALVWIFLPFKQNYKNLQVPLACHLTCLGTTT